MALITYCYFLQTFKMWKLFLAQGLYKNRLRTRSDQKSLVCQSLIYDSVHKPYIFFQDYVIIVNNEIIYIYKSDF